jgi:hypothetical protein
MAAAQIGIKAHQGGPMIRELGAVLLLAAAGCTYQGAPVPVAGDTRMLEGEWEGTYSSEQTGRTGSILFHLKAGTDSAYGDVLMLPTQAEYSRPPTLPETPRPFNQPARVLNISFVQCADAQVTGRLDPYEDPDTGERLYTTFEGRFKGNTFKGTFVTLYPNSGHRVTGKWTVERKRK